MNCFFKKKILEWKYIDCFKYLIISILDCQIIWLKCMYILFRYVKNMNIGLYIKLILNINVLKKNLV